LCGGVSCAVAALVVDDHVATAIDMVRQGAAGLVQRLTRKYASNETIVEACGGLVSALSCCFEDEWGLLTRLFRPLPVAQAAFIDMGLAEFFVQVGRQATRLACFQHPFI
jgi:hypothetical protein